eukprot:TRINITY_DN4576_c0_g1_i1.p1 TRINITY_DN4576_c0_g1~~TRINITY_DN4576_c0_g1_i1.p1  ORF type:complete len:514 (+),score=50.53 TRINITY_DN4576_c0_g1_i1:76-1542(+)
MSSKSLQLHALFLPFLAPGHIIPIADMAVLFAQRGAKASIVTTPVNASFIQNTIDRARDSGLSIQLHLLQFPYQDCGLPQGCENMNLGTSMDERANVMKGFIMLQEPMDQLIRQLLPNCIVSDMLCPWTTDLARELQIPRLVFHGTNFFSLCYFDSLKRYAPHDKVASDTEPFVVPGLPDPIEMTRFQMPVYYKVPDNFSNFLDLCKEAELRSYGVVVNSFFEMEPAYVVHYKEAMGIKAWHIGPVSLCNRETTDKAVRWKIDSINKEKCLNWLDSMEPKSVVYVCFGSLALLKKSQLLEIAMGLESSNRPFIWVVRECEVSNEEEEEEWLPRGFEERNKGKSLIIRGWAPQILILDHPAIGGFVTHCGWNSIIESVAAGVPMITWPLFAEQFENEKLIVHVAKVGIEIGVGVWSHFGSDRGLVRRDDVVTAVERLMDGGEEGGELRKRARALGEVAKRAVKEGGSSYVDLGQLIDQLTTVATAAQSE